HRPRRRAGAEVRGALGGPVALDGEDGRARGQEGRIGRMTDEQAREVYARARLGQSVTLGARPAILVVDFSCGFTDPQGTLGSELSSEVEATKRLLDTA